MEEKILLAIYEQETAKGKLEGAGKAIERIERLASLPADKKQAVLASVGKKYLTALKEHQDAVMRVMKLRKVF
jgi:hypothetical protein